MSLASIKLHPTIDFVNDLHFSIYIAKMEGLHYISGFSCFSRRDAKSLGLDAYR